MRCLIIAAVVALALARPHPRPPRNDIARSLAKEKRSEIAEGIGSAAKNLHALAKKPHGSKEHAKPVDPEVAEKKREEAEREAKAVESSRRQSDELKKEIEKKRLAKEKVQNDMKQMHKALTEVSTTTTTTAAPIDNHVLDIPEEPKAKAPPTPAQLAKMEEEKRETQEKAREAEEATKKQEAALKKSKDEAKKLKEQEKHLHSVANELKQASSESTDTVGDSVKKDEAAAAKLMKEIGGVSKQVATVVQPASLAPPEKKIEVPKVVQQADEEAKRLLKTKTHERSKEAQKKTQEEIESEVRSNAESLHAAAMDAESKKIEADMKQQAESIKEVRLARTPTKEEIKIEKEAKDDMMKSSSPHRMFRPAKFNPKAPEEVAKRATEEDARREGDLQDKMHDMMGSMEKIRSQIEH